MYVYIIFKENNSFIIVNNVVKLNNILNVNVKTNLLVIKSLGFKYIPVLAR